MDLIDLETPCLVLDRGKIQKNISGMLERMEALGTDLRPHGKTAKNYQVLEMALRGQPGGIAVSTLKEAEYYSDHGVNDIVYAVGIAPVKMDRVASLIKRGIELSVLLDSMEQVRFVAAKAREHGVEMPVFIEIDSDGHRSGVSPASSILLDIGRQLEEESLTKLIGILTHAGESYKCRTPSDIKNIAEQERNAAVKSAEMLRKAGLPCPVVSVGSTPTAKFAEDLTGVTEVRAGVFMFYDLMMAGLGVCHVEDIAISVMTSIIGHQKSKGWIMTDGGWTALSSDRSTASQEVDQGYGLVCDMDGNPIPGLIVSSVNQEHGIITERHGKEIDWSKFNIGSKLRILPNHACATAAMHDNYMVVNGSTEVTDKWQSIRGW
jgi:D-serine deaminase-like pyridoxal phosphate-dependent protein